MKKIFILVLSMLALVSLHIYADVSAPLFSTLKPGQALPKPLHFIALPKIKHNAVSLVDDAVDNQRVTVLKVESNNSAGSIGIPLTATLESGNTTLEWRWKVNRVLEKADMSKKLGDDFAGRVYVFFDVPLESLSFVERSKIRLARAVAGADVPTAALCYVWDNTHAIGHSQWSPYTNRVRKIVLQTGSSNINKWMKESRDVAADFKTAFGFDAPAVTGVAVGNDTDNTDDNVTTWYGDVKFIKPL
jgi:Protein of unknown function (DUF3047)